MISTPKLSEQYNCYLPHACRKPVSCTQKSSLPLDLHYFCSRHSRLRELQPSTPDLFLLISYSDWCCRVELDGGPRFSLPFSPSNLAPIDCKACVYGPPWASSLITTFVSSYFMCTVTPSWPHAPEILNLQTIHTGRKTSISVQKMCKLRS